MSPARPSTRSADGHSHTRPAKLSELIADAIADEILTQRLRPGTRLPNEAQMVERYEAGRATIRETLRLLEADGLIDIRPGFGGGPTVCPPDMARVARRLSILLRLSGSTFGSVVHARIAIEPALAGQAALTATDEQVAAIRASVEALRGTVDGGVGFVEENARFHSLIGEASNSPVLMTFWLSIRRISDGQELGMRYSARARRAVAEAHQRVAEAIARRDVDGASAEMREHVVALDEYLTHHNPDVIAGSIRVDAPR